VTRVPLLIPDGDPVWTNVESTAERVGRWPAWKRPPLFEVAMTCCDRDDGRFGPVPWSTADEFREAYLSGPGVGSGGHVRSAIIVDAGARAGSGVFHG
jgi:hypothetical protein